MKTRNLKSLFTLVLVAAVLSACASAPGNRRFAPGSFLGVGAGLYGPVLVEVSMSAVDRIDAIRVLSHDETFNIGNVPFELLPGRIVQHQSLQVDIVTGATISSIGFLAAVRDAITRAGSDPGNFTGAVPPIYVPHQDTTADVVVIGGGGAGMTAAIHAARAGKRVILVEKLGIVGGTTTFAIEGYGSTGSITHRNLGTDITPAMQAQILTNNNPRGLPEAYQLFAHNSGPGADWLRSIGAMLTVAAGQMGVQASREVGEIGVTIMSALRLEAAHVGVDVRVNSRAVEILMENNAAAGIRVSTRHGDYTIRAPAVIVATGGFAANREMVVEHRPELDGFRFASTTGARGDGHRMAQAVGAGLENMDHIRINYVYAISPHTGFSYYAASPVNTGAIIVNNDGQRFVNDQSGYHGGLAVLAQGGRAWAIFDNTIRESVREVRRLGSLDLFYTADTLQELASLIGVNPAGLLNTVERYRGFVDAGADADFNRPMINMRFEKAPFHALQMHIHVQGTFGGVRTNLSAEVLTPAGAVIPGLFAAGEVASEGTFGTHPVSVNTVFGRIAAESATAFLASR